MKSQKNTPKNKVTYHYFRVYCRGRKERLARTSVDLITRKQTQVNVHINFYENGKFPYFQHKHLIQSMDYTFRFPAWVIKDIYKRMEKAGCTFRKNKHQRFKVSEFDLQEEVVEVVA